MFSFLLRRWSHIGRRPVAFDSRVNVAIVDKLGPPVSVFGHTRIAQCVQVSGKLGSLQFPVHRGLTVNVSDSAVSGEKILNVSMDEAVCARFPKRCRKFVRGMWGTTAAVLRQHIEGVTDVCLLSSTLLTH